MKGCPMQSIFTPKNEIIITRSYAKYKGQAHYCTGKPCGNGHFSQRYVSNRCCVQCIEIGRNKYATDNPQAALDALAKYKASDKGKAAQKRANDKYLGKIRRRVVIELDGLPL